VPAASDRIEVKFHDHTYAKLVMDRGLARELNEVLSFQPPNYQFQQSYKNRVWDGYIRMFNLRDSTIRVGLLGDVKQFCEDRGYEFINECQQYTSPDLIDEQYVLKLAKFLKAKFTPKDHQIKSIVSAINDGRSLSLSPTSSGKSFIMYLMQGHYRIVHTAKTLIIVPAVSLVYQLAADFEDYGMDRSKIHVIKAGASKDAPYEADVTITTWQSIVDQPADWFSEYDVIFGDEAHLFQAKSLTTIFDKTGTIRFKHGFTGTVSSESKIGKMVLEGMFGSIRKFISTAELMENGDVADFNIKAIVLNHSDEIKNDYKAAAKALKDKYKNSNKKPNMFATEKEFLINLPSRNNFIVNLTHSLAEQNNLILFDRVEKHGAVLAPLLEKEGRILHYIHGGVKGTDREKVRHMIENDNKDVVTLEFGELMIIIDADSPVMLSNGKTKLASSITCDDDVSDIWIKEASQTGYNK
jgi:superfamily II DNA or RNA helicase